MMTRFEIYLSRNEARPSCLFKGYSTFPETGTEYVPKKHEIGLRAFCQAAMYGSMEASCASLAS